jgi:DivIVA domain-containing protein
VIPGQSNIPFQSPSSIRNEVFGHRMRGLDEEEVRDYLELLADQVEAMDADRARQRREIDELRVQNDQLRAENQRLRDAPQPASDLDPQTVALLNQAQQVADQVVEQAVVHARDMLKSARSQQRDILQNAYRAAEQAVRMGGSPRTQVTPARPSNPRAEDIRTPDRMTQAQLRSVVDALSGKWDRDKSSDEEASIYDQVWSIRGRAPHRGR